MTGKTRPKYKDPFALQYLGARATVTQKELWPIIRDTVGVKAALIGGKGSAKTTTAAGFLIDRAQKYPGSKAFIAAATYQQAIESCAYQITKVAKIMGLPFIYKKEMVIDDLPHRYVYYFPDFNSNICIRSEDNMDMIEGSEWDAGVLEEIQLWNMANVPTALARIRRGMGDHARMIVGLPEDQEHPQYAFLEENDFILREISTVENLANLPDEYLGDLLKMYPGEEGKRFISGERVSLHSLPVQAAYRSEIHKTGPVAKRLAFYDPYKPLVISFDFNVAPCCVTLWQVKNYKFNVIREDERNGEKYEAVEIKPIIAQVDEFEGWRVGTRGTCEMIIETYKNHTAGGIVLGDAAGNHSDTRTVSSSDWKIIQEEFAKIPDMAIKKGLVMNRRGQSGGRSSRRKEGGGEKLAKYSNPPLKDSIDNLNRALVDSDGDPGVVFLPESKYESGGASGSMSSTKYSASGSVDESPDRQAGKKVRRTHYWATVRYAIWYLMPPNKDVPRSAPGKRNYSVLDNIKLTG